MNPEIGRQVRRLGIMIEGVALLFLVLVRRGVIAPANLNGLEPTFPALIAISIGFALWFVGTAAIYWPRKPRKAAQPNDDLAEKRQ